MIHAQLYTTYDIINKYMRTIYIPTPLTINIVIVRRIDRPMSDDVAQRIYYYYYYYYNVRRAKVYGFSRT